MFLFRSLDSMKQFDSIEMSDVCSPFAWRGQLKTAAIELPSGSDCTRSLNSSSGETPYSGPHVDDLWGKDNTARIHRAELPPRGRHLKVVS